MKPMYSVVCRITNKTYYSKKKNGNTAARQWHSKEMKKLY